VYYHRDGLGSTVALSDATGQIVERYRYDVFGRVEIRSATGESVPVSLFGNRFLFTGREWLSEVGLYDYRNRVYSAELGRFLQTDPIRFSAGDGNLYRYVSNNAVNLRDPLGLMQLDPVQGLIELKLKWDWEIDGKTPTGPVGSSVDDNICESTNRGFSPNWFYNQVKNRGPWDYKQYGGYQNQAFGNFNYGAAGAANGFGSTTLKRMAGWAQTQAGTSNPNWGDPGKFFGKVPVPFTGIPPYGDDPDDQYWINAGIDYQRANPRNR
jgi:RHS repeat-associated protein